MKENLYTYVMLSLLFFAACNSNTQKSTPEQDAELAQVKEEQFDLRNDSLIFSSATIENFDPQGRSIDVYWLDEDRDTILFFYRKYDDNQQLIGAEYYEEGDTSATIDTVFTNEEGLQVEASLNAEGQISWASTIKTDDKGNETLRTYKNGRGEYRGFDSLALDDQNRVIRGFYENANGKRYRIKTYEYLKSDSYNNWIERNLFVNDTLSQRHVRTLTYHQ
ncbi:MAG: hypothetical protein AAGG75_23170 [Bacteroidota bacterium]